MKTYRIPNSIVAFMAAVVLSFTGLIPTHAAEKTSKPSIDVSKVRVPEVYGTIKEVRKGGDKVIFYLQDAHCNFEAQQNNARILQDLMNQFGIDTVGIEGDAGPVDLSDLAAYPDKEALEDTATYFMSQGRIRGPEFVAITGGKPFALIGLEDKALIEANRDTLKQFVPNQSQAVAEVNKLRTVMGSVADKVFSADLKAIADKIAAYRAGKIKFTEYAQALRDAASKSGVDISAHKNFDLQGKSFDMEGKIDFDAVENERAALVDELSKKLSKDETSNLVVQSLSFRLGRMNAVEYYDILKGLCDKATVDMKSKANLVKYIDYIKAFDQINKDALVDEADAIAVAVKDKMFTSDDQRKLDKMIQQIDWLGKMFEIKLGIREHPGYKLAAAQNSIASVVDFVKDQAGKNSITMPTVDVNALANNQAQIEKFYDTAVERDAVLAKNAIALVKDKGLDRMAMVTGGFHTRSVADQLVKEGFSVVIITPRITDFDVKSPYVDVIMDKPIPTRDILGSSKKNIQAETADVGGKVGKGQPARAEFDLYYARSVVSRALAQPEGAARNAASDSARQELTAKLADPSVGADVKAALPELIAKLKVPGTPEGGGEGAKAIGLSAEPAVSNAVTDAVGAPAVADVLAEVTAMFAGDPNVDLTNIEVVAVDDPAVLMPDGRTFKLRADGKMYGYAQIRVVGGRVRIGIPKGLLVSARTNEADKNLLLLALVKDTNKGRSAAADGYDSVSNRDANVLAKADKVGLMAEARVSMARILGDLANYDIGVLLEMASDGTTTAQYQKPDGSDKYADSEIQAFVKKLALDVQKHIVALLVAKAQNAVDLAAIQAYTGLAADVKANVLATYALHAVNGQIAAMRDAGLHVVGPNFFPVNAEGAAIAPEIIYQEANAQGQIERKGEPIANGDKVQAVVKGGNTTGFTYLDPVQGKPQAAEIAQHEREITRGVTLGEMTKDFRALIGDKVKNLSDDVLTVFNIEDLWDVKYDDTGRPTLGSPKTANAQAYIAGLKARGKPYAFTAKDTRITEADLKNMVKHGLGVRGTELDDNAPFTDPNAIFVAGNTNAQAVNNEILRQYDAIKGKDAHARLARILWAAYKGDGVRAAFGTNGTYKVVEGDENTAFDVVLAALLSDSTTVAEFQAAAAKAGFSNAAVAALGDVAVNGGIVPGWPKSEEELKANKKDPRNITRVSA